MELPVQTITKIAARKKGEGYLIDVYRDPFVNTFSTDKKFDYIAVDERGAVYGYYGTPLIRETHPSMWFPVFGGGAFLLGNLGVNVSNWKASVTPLTLALALGGSKRDETGAFKTQYTLSIPIPPAYEDLHIMTAVEKMPLGAEIVAVEYEGELLPFSFKPNRIEVHNDTITFLHSQRMAGFTAEVSFKRGTMLQVIV